MTHILFIGCGNLGKSILSGLQKNGHTNITAIVATQDSANQLATQHAITTLTPTDPPPTKADIVILAIKPQMMQDVLPNYQRLDSLFISVAAGTNTKALTNLLGKKPIIRSMPNLAASIGESTTAIFANAQCTETHKQQAEQLLNTIGTTHWLTEESQIDSFTALAGSGPAFNFYFAECLINAATELGLPKDLAITTTLNMLAASTHLAQQSEKDLEALRQSVTSKGGTTQAGLEILTQSLQPTITQTLTAATNRAKKL